MKIIGLRLMFVHEFGHPRPVCLFEAGRMGGVLISNTRQILPARMRLTLGPKCGSYGFESVSGSEYHHSNGQRN
jgi:hypothetical protein